MRVKYKQNIYENKKKSNKMPSQTQKTGKLGEEIAEKYLEQNGYEILAKNWHCRYGEIDIIAKEQVKDTLFTNKTIPEIVFVEVKSRKNENTNETILAATPAKMSKVKKSGYQYMTKNNINNTSYRYDVIAVAINHIPPHKIRHEKNIEISDTE